MSWVCETCNTEHDAETTYCTACYGPDYYQNYETYDASYANYDPNVPYAEENDSSTYVSSAKKTVCPNCFHKHLDGLHCHVYIENDPGDEEEEEEIVEEEEEFDPMQFRKQKKGQPAKPKERKIVPLKTPKYVSDIGYVRCNCKVGIPTGDTNYEPLPKDYFVGDIRVLTYDEIEVKIERELKDSEIEANLRELQYNASFQLPQILSFLPLSILAPAAMVNKDWNAGSNNYGYYRDVRNCVPYFAFRPHELQVDAVLLIGQRLFTGGDRRVYVSDITTGEKLHQVTRDTGSIPLLVHLDDYIVCCSNNGAMRLFELMHNVKRIHLDRTMWEHSRRVTAVVFGERSVGNCATHGIENHICVMYTASEDRSIRVWDLEKYIPIKNIPSKMVKRYTILSMCISDRHVMAGTSGGTVLIYSRYSVCERDDVHKCGVPNATEGDTSFCLQVTLRLPEMLDVSGNYPGITSLLCVGAYGSRELLWAGDSTGRLTIWKVPEIGVDYTPAKSWKPHKLAIQCMVHTWGHVITAGDDGCIILHDIITLAKMRRIDVRDWAVKFNLIDEEFAAIPRMIKCMHVVEDSVNGGLLVVGTSFGDVFLMSIGTFI